MKPSQRRKQTHMDKVYELQHLTRHFTKLWNEKSTIDNKTPRSFYLNPRSTHYIGKSAGRSQSADGMRKSSNLDLHRRAMSANKKLDLRRTEFAPVDNLTGNSMARRYERRFLQSDIMDKNFYEFAQPERSFEPRTLLTNFAQPKIIKSRNYQPPVFYRRNRLSDSMKMKDRLNATWNGDGQSKKTDNLWTASPEPPLARSLSPTGSLFRDRVSPNLLKYSPRMSMATTRTRSALSRKSPHRKEDEELKYYQFVQEVTKDIIDRGVYSDRVLKNIIANHMERRRNDLNMTRMRQLLTKLLSDLGVSQEGLLSTHAEKASHPENVHFDPESFAREEQSRRREWNAEDALRIDDYSQNQRNARTTLERTERVVSADQFEELDENASSVSLNDQDIDDIIEGRNLDQLIARRSSKLKAPDKKTSESPAREHSFVQSSSSIAVKSTLTGKQKVDQSAKSESDATPSQYESGQSEDENTLGDEVSELEDDDAAEKLNQSSEGDDVTSSSRSSLASGTDQSSTVSSSSSSLKDYKLNQNRTMQTRKSATAPPPKRMIVANSIFPPLKKLSQQSHLSSQDSIHMEASPPKKLSNDSDTDMFAKPTMVPLSMNDFPAEDTSIRTPSIDVEDEEDEDDTYSRSGSSVASEMDDEGSRTLEWKKKDKDDHGSEEVEEEEKNGTAPEKLPRKQLVQTNAAQNTNITSGSDKKKEGNSSVKNNEVHTVVKESQEDKNHQSNKQLIGETGKDTKPIINEPAHQILERRVSGASDSEHLLSDSRRSPDPELLRQRRDSFLKQLEQQKTDEKAVEDEKTSEEQIRSRIGSEQVDDPPFGPSPTHEISAPPHEKDIPSAATGPHTNPGQSSPKTFENSETQATIVSDETPTAPPRRFSKGPESGQSEQEGKVHSTQSEETDQPRHDVAEAPGTSQSHDEDAPLQRETVHSPRRATGEEDGSDNAFESENKEEEDSASSDSGDGTVDIYAKDPTGQDFDERDNYYPPLSPITELPETPLLKDMETLHGSMDSNRSLKQGIGVLDLVRPVQKPPVPAPRRISNASYGSSEHDRNAPDDQGGGERRVSNASVNN